MFDGIKVCFTAFSVEETSESLAFYTWLKANFKPASISTFYWGGEEVRAKIPADVETIEISDVHSLKPEMLEAFDLIVRHTSTHPDQLPKGVASTTSTKEFFARCKAPIVGVTGTKGKGTTATLIYEIFKEAGVNTQLVGNIGKAALSVIDDISPRDVVVFELSSFQLWDLEKSPHIAVVTPVSEDHMDVHNSLEEYVAAKANIARYQTEADMVFYHPTNELSKQVASEGKGKKLRFLTEEAAHIINNTFVIDEQKICSLDDIQLLGRHNLENIAAAISVAWQYTKDIKAINGAVTGFKGLEHRLEFVREVSGVKFYNDSFSTTFTSVAAALETFADRGVFIMGGYDKKTGFKELAAKVAEQKPKHILLIGETGPMIASELESAGYKNFELTDSKEMTQIVALAAGKAEEGDSVVLSPACASFDMFKSYKERGELFKQAVNELS